MARIFFILNKYLSYPRGRSFNKFSSAFENGVNFFDISEPFTSKRAEIELGRIIKKNGWTRRQFVVSTKVYWDKSDKDNNSEIIFIFYFPRTEGKALSRKEIIESVRDSLKNLQLEYIDLLIIHKNDPNCPIEGKNFGFDKLFDGDQMEFFIYEATLLGGMSLWSKFNKVE